MIGYIMTCLNTTMTSAFWLHFIYFLNFVVYLSLYRRQYSAHFIKDAYLHSLLTFLAWRFFLCENFSMLFLVLLYVPHLYIFFPLYPNPCSPHWAFIYYIIFLYSQRNIVGHQCVTYGHAAVFTNSPAFLQLLFKILLLEFIHWLLLSSL